MSSVRIGVIAGFLATLALSAPAQADVLYEQTGTTSACPPGACRTSTLGHSGGNLYGFQTFDNFTLGQGARINNVTWRGFIYDGDGNAPAPEPITTTWQIGFYADDGAAMPDADPALYLVNLAAADVDVTFLADDTFAGDGVKVYEWSADLPTDFLAAAGVRYWFSPVSLQPAFTPLFAWSAATPTAGLSYQRQYVNGAWGDLMANGNNRAFSVSGAYVPEPGTWALLILGFGGAGLMLRRAKPATA